MDSQIKKILAREILDSRGDPTIEVSVTLENGLTRVASVPSGASTGIHEAVELRDGDKKRYGGKGVLRAVKNVNEKINKFLTGFDVLDQEKIDQKMIDMDGSANKENLGANAMLGVSLSIARTAATFKNIPLYQYLRHVFNLKNRPSLPIPLFNVFNGGKHADTNLDFQEFHIIPIMNTSFKERLRSGSEIFHAMAAVLKNYGLDIDVGNEGGYAPNIDSSVKAVEYIMESIDQAGYKAGKEVVLGMDAGASSFYLPKERLYNFSLDESFLESDQLIYLYHEWFKKYPFILIEDPLAEDDWHAWQKMTKEFSGLKLTIHNYRLDDKKFIKLHEKNLRPIIVGDDLFTTNTGRLGEGIKLGVANAVIVKPNQIGTLTETIKFARLAQNNDYQLVVSHRSGETFDDFIADLSVALGAEFIKAGAPSRGERVTKYNRLLKIEEELT
ncbi:phosphopyruvate hydratase [Candidatus Kuenenbacteria bacterium]|nr:phosphopyruvate hydratase [Candidatus Kuenenbacteria bacterium]